MAFKLSELLNPAPASEESRSQDSRSVPPVATEAVQQHHFSLNVPMRLPPPASLGLPNASFPSSQQASVAHMAVVEPPAPLDPSASSRHVDQYQYLPQPQGQVHIHAKTHPSLIPAPSLPSNQSRYNIAPPKTQFEGVDRQLPPSRPVAEIPDPKFEADQNITIMKTMETSDVVVARENEEPDENSLEIAKSEELKAPQQEIAALGLAALDGVDEGEGDTHSAVNENGQRSTKATKSPSNPKSSNRTKHGTAIKPSEGSIDKRYLCYICIKLFTRRRSVRDHIKKIHNDSTFDVSRAIEVKVDPDTGESLIPLEELVATMPTSRVIQAGHDPASRSPSRASSAGPASPPGPAPTSGKKRNASDLVGGNVSTKKKVVRKPKPIDTAVGKIQAKSEGSVDPAMSRSPSATPVSSRASRTPAISKTIKANKSHTPSPARSDRISVAMASEHDATESEDEDSNATEDEEMEHDTDEKNGDNGEEQGELFCICRKGDNHTWMIGCDGDCEDWFHGKCVNIKEEDGNLIDKYICPSCEGRGKGQTTWKRRCRLQQCRKPARVLADPPSKYCSDECARRFMVGLVKRSDPTVIVSEDGLTILGATATMQTSDLKQKDERRKNIDSGVAMDGDESDNNSDGGVPLVSSRKAKQPASSTNDENLPPLTTRGGPLTLADIQFMMSKAKTIEDIRKMGEKPATPPLPSNLEDDLDTDTKMTNGVDAAHPITDEKRFPYNDQELTGLTRIATKKHAQHVELELIRSNEKFAYMAKTYSANLIEELNLPKAKAPCGYDSRLTWNRAEFDLWRQTPAGKAAMASGVVGAPEDESSSSNATDPKIKTEDPDPDTPMLNGHPTSSNTTDSNTPDSDGQLRGICLKTKCARHRDWKRNASIEYRFDADDVLGQIKKLDEESRIVRESAAMRVLWVEDRRAKGEIP